MAETGPVHIPQPIPDPNRLHPETGQRQSSATFFLRSTPPIFRALVVGGNNSNVDSGLTRAALPPVFLMAPMPPMLLTSRSITVPFALAVAGCPSLVRTRALGAPKIGATLGPAGLTRTRAIGAIEIRPGWVPITSLVRVRGLGTPAVSSSVQGPSKTYWHRSLKGVERMDEWEA